MKTIILIITSVILFSCAKEHNLSRISYQTQDTTLIPLVVMVNDVVVDTINNVGTFDCAHTTEYVLAETNKTYNVRIYNPTYDTSYTFRLNNNECELITIIK